MLSRALQVGRVQNSSRKLYFVDAQCRYQGKGYRHAKAVEIHRPPSNTAEVHLIAQWNISSCNLLEFLYQAQWPIMARIPSLSFSSRLYVAGFMSSCSCVFLESS